MNKNKYLPKNHWIKYNQELIFDEIAKIIPLNKIHKVIDVGCGKGDYLSYLSKTFKNAHCFGIDISKNAISLAKELGNFPVILADAQYLPIKDKSFDLVFEKDLLHHVNDHVKALKELARISKRYVILIEANRENFINAVAAKYGDVAFTENQMKTMLKKAGFSAKFYHLNTYTISIESQKKNPVFLIPYYTLFILRIVVDRIPLLSKLLLSILPHIMRKPTHNLFYIVS